MDQSRSPLRLLAPVALVAFGLALGAIVASSTPPAGPAASSGSSTAAQGDAQGSGDGESSAGDSRPSTRRRRRSYTVRGGDTLGAIAEDTGVSVEELQRLNPDLDPQALGAGEKLKLR